MFAARTFFCTFFLKKVAKKYISDKQKAAQKKKVRAAFWVLHKKVRAAKQNPKNKTKPQKQTSKSPVFVRFWVPLIRVWRFCAALVLKKAPYTPQKNILSPLTNKRRRKKRKEKKRNISDQKSIEPPDKQKAAQKKTIARVRIRKCARQT